ncbi:hypothetical protein [Streptomyces sp. KR80]|uniref:hypothetical protein n=1 Tax=Streptomyces sp. KR80 TaxID=3457426 RepID=UPI003FD16067
MSTPAMKTHKCTECEQLEGKRKQAEQDRDYSSVSECNVLIARYGITHSVRS